MDILLLRHAEAEALGEKNHYEDEARALTEAGRKQVQALSRGLKLLELRLDCIVSSPLLRARQTAEIVMEGLKFPERMLIWQELAPGCSAAKLFQRFSDISGRESVLLVGHEPDIGLLASHLLYGSNKGSIPFKKGGICCIQTHQNTALLGGQLKWMLPPKLLAKLMA
jgi:phosphohistidine phosphatase